MEKLANLDRTATLEEICAALTIAPKMTFEFACTCGIDCRMKFDLSEATFGLAEEFAWMELARESRDAKVN